MYSHTDDLIIYLLQLKKYLSEEGVKKAIKKASNACNEELITYTRDPIDEIIKKLKKGD